jgi:hypothetical protein
MAFACDGLLKNKTDRDATPFFNLIPHCPPPPSTASSSKISYPWSVGSTQTRPSST